MAKAEFDIPKLFEIVFNYRMMPYPLLVAERPYIMAATMGVPGVKMPVDTSMPFATRSNPDFEIMIPTRREKSSVGQPFYARNLLGLEMFMPVTLVHKDTKGVKSEILLQNTIISMKMKKTIVETPLIGRQGTVKEMISIDDWDINLKGMIVSADNEYPDDAVKELKDFVEINEALDIASVLTAIMLDKDEKIVIKDFELAEMRGIQHAQGFTLSLVSDMQFDLILG